MGIHVDATARIDRRAELEDGVRVGPYAVIEGAVHVGEGTVVGPHAVLYGPTRLGRANRIGAGAALGTAPQDVGYRGEPTELVVGDENEIREYVTISRGTVKGGGLTRVGNRCFFMHYSHVGHDVQVGDGVVLTNAAALAGHTHVGDGAVIGGMAGIHQFVAVGRLAMVGALAMVRQDVPPFMLVAGNPARVHGLNAVGLRRAGIGPGVRDLLKQAYRLLYRSSLGLEEALARIEALGDAAELAELAAFARSSRRGIVREEPGRSDDL
ncbi:acyl-ACP--UDP-N-acetylglucosamine O-acyltransferase [Limnochorda pilosa]|uniref:UDP-N-acetylglucosamine acyltransferase n=1 Tax=Limnochorda pilosa TaxID=1555112 RepID=A0A0K2SPG3_LIMPI|nr:acyl-ACP--UDP-N-acetylglucosamine O-acyltransferase [Limnochorda pilosa]BAS28892.1 UDP-N-acetylglucosamine acyltransferase [Limnochorda pilosa]